MMKMTKKPLAIGLAVVLGMASGSTYVMAKDYTVTGGTFAMANPADTNPMVPGNPGVLTTGEYQPWAEIVATFQFGFMGPVYIYTAESNTAVDYDGGGFTNDAAGTLPGGPVPSLDLAMGTGNMKSWFVQWSNNEFNQGSTNITVTNTGSLTWDLTWSSTIVGGAFDGQTGYWVLGISCTDAAPVVTEPEDIQHLRGQPFTDPGLDITDDDDDYAVAVLGTVDADTIGSYDLMYTVTDSCVRSSAHIRTINVVTNPEAPTLEVTPDPLTHMVNTTFDPMTGVTCNDVVDGDLTSSVVVTANDVDENTIGAYAVSYSCTDSESNPATYENRVVNVTDNTIPVISRTGDATVTIEACSTYNDAGATCSDEQDGDLTADIVTGNPVDDDVPGVYTVTYDCEDSQGADADQVTREVTVEDKTNPTMADGEAVTLELGATYTDNDALSGITCDDCVDGSLTSGIVVDNPVDPNTEGSYTVTYTCTDGAGNETEATRSVTVEEVGCEIGALDVNNFTMLSGGGGLAGGGANDVTFTWDGTLNTDPETAVVNATLGSKTPFFDVLWYTHDLKVYGPGTYTFDTCFENEVDSIYPCASMTVTVGPDQIGCHFLFDWNNVLNIDAFNVWERNAVYGPSPFYTTGGGNPNQVWDLMSSDGDDDGVNGIAFVDGPFIGFRANFNVMLPESAPQLPAEDPVLLVEGDNPLLLDEGAIYEDPEAQAADLKDGCLENIFIYSNTPGDVESVGQAVNTLVPGVYARTYQVTDSNGNTAKEELLIVVVGEDFPGTATVVAGETKNHPVIILQDGDAEIDLLLGADDYRDGGAIAIDLQDGTLTVTIESITRDGVPVSAVNTEIAGVYVITYTVTDNGSNPTEGVTALAEDSLTTTATRTVRVNEPLDMDRGGGNVPDQPAGSSDIGCSATDKPVNPMHRAEFLLIGVFLAMLGIGRAVKSQG